LQLLSIWIEKVKIEQNLLHFHFFKFYTCLASGLELELSVPKPHLVAAPASPKLYGSASATLV
jgi:hypothetical protein